MKKLTKNSPVVDFYKTAHNLILSKSRFTMHEIYNEMWEQCEEDVSFDFVKPIILEELDDLLNNGLVMYVDEGVGVYENTLTQAKGL